MKNDNTQQKQQTNNSFSEFEIEYEVTGTLKTKIRANNIDEAYNKATSATAISKIISESINNLLVNGFAVIKITDSTGATYNFEYNDEEILTIPIAPKTNDDSTEE